MSQCEGLTMVPYLLLPLLLSLPPQDGLTPAVVDPIDRAGDSVATVHVGESGVGACWVVLKGWMITNQHVVGNATTVTVEFEDGTKKKATVTHVSKKRDLALLQVDTCGRRPLSYCSKQVLRNTPVYTIGSPGGYRGTISRGIVSAIDRTVKDPTAYSREGLIQVDIPAIRPGSSGGPLLNEKGEVIGVVFATHAYGPGVGWCLPVSYVTSFLEDVQKE